MLYWVPCMHPAHLPSPCPLTGPRRWSCPLPRGEALAFLSRPGMLVGRAAMKTSNLISAAEKDARNKVEESSKWSRAWKPDL